MIYIYCKCRDVITKIKIIIMMCPKFFSDKLFLMIKSRSTHPDVFCKRGVLINFTKFTGKHLFQGSFFCRPGPATLLKKTPLDDCFCKSSHVKFQRLFPFPRFIKWHFLEFKIKISYHKTEKCTKVNLRIVY